MGVTWGAEMGGGDGPRRWPSVARYSSSAEMIFFGTYMCVPGAHSEQIRCGAPHRIRAHRQVGVMLT